MALHRLGHIIAAVCLVAPALGAQSDSGPTPTAVRRVLASTGHDQWHVGLLVGEDSAKLGILLEGRRDTTWFARSAVTEMLVSTGKQNHATAGAEFGLFAGMIGGAAIAVAHAPSCTPDSWVGGLNCTGNSIDKVGRGFAGGLIGAVAGGAVGEFLGWLIKTERWERVK